MNCADLGGDWELALIDNDAEAWEALYLHTTFGHACHCYQIGGSTNYTSMLKTPFSRYYHDNSGTVSRKLKYVCNGSKINK